MKTLFIALAAAVFLPTAGFSCSKPQGASGLESAMIQWINEQRQAKGLGTLRTSSKLQAAAQGHACDMATRGYFGHQRAGGPDLSARVKAQGYRFRKAAENIAKTSAPDVGRAAGVWRKSSGHWANILKPDVSEIGLATASDGGSTYWVMNIGKSR